MGNGRQQLKVKRLKLWKADPRCHYCGVETVWRDGQLSGKRWVSPRRKVTILTEDERNVSATIDHIRPRHHPDRRKPPQPGEVLQVLSCWKCNNDRDRDELRAKPPEWHEANGGTPRVSRQSTERLFAAARTLAAIRPKKRDRQSIKRSQTVIAWELWERGEDF